MGKIEHVVSWERRSLRGVRRYAHFYDTQAQAPVTVSGSLGLWWGRPEIQSTRFRNLAEAIHKCVDGAQDMVVTLEKGILTVEGLHHDGTNCFTIHREHGYFWPKYLF